MVVKHGKLSSNEFQQMKDGYVMDLIALFNCLEDDVNKLVVKAEKEGWTPDVLIKKIEELI